MHQFSKSLQATLVVCSYLIQICQPALAAERDIDVYPVPPLPPADAFAPQWIAPRPTLTGRSKMPEPVKYEPSIVSKDFPDQATLSEVDSACLTIVPLKSPRLSKAGIFTDQKLKAFLKNHNQKGGVLDANSIKRLESFLSANLGSPFRYTMLMELADAQWRHGWFTRALDTWKIAWGIGSKQKDPQDAAHGQMSLSQLLFAYSKLGEKAALRSLIAEAKNLNLSAPAMEAYRQAETTLWHLEHRAEQNIFCGFTALNTICVPLGMRPAFPDIHDEAEKKMFIEDGLSVAELIAHSHESEGKSIAVKRAAGASIPVPSVVHWKFNHYSAITKQENGRFYIEDFNLKFAGWVERSVLEEEKCVGTKHGSSVFRAGSKAVETKAK